MSVFAIVQEADTIVTFTQIHPFVGTGLEAGPIPAGVVVCRSLHIAPLDFVGGLRREHIDRERNLEQSVFFPPFDMGVKIQPG